MSKTSRSSRLSSNRRRAARAPQRDQAARRRAGQPGRPGPSRLLRALLARVDSWLGGLLSRFHGWLQARRGRRPEAGVRGFKLETLEPRVLMSADLMPAALPQASPLQAAFTALHNAQQSAAATGGQAGPQQMGPQQPGSAVQAGFVPSNPATGAVLASALAAPTANTSTVTDNDGTQATASISGEGLVSLTAQDGGYALMVTGTNADSVLTLSTSGGDGRLRLTGIEVSAALGQANLGLADLTGLAVFAGGVQQLTLGDVTNATLRHNAPGTASIILGEVLNLRLSVPQATLALTADSWGASLPGAAPSSSFIEAAAISALNVAGDFAADVRVAGLEGLDQTVRGVNVAGAIAAGQWYVRGNVQDMRAGSTGGGWRMQVTNELRSLVTTGDLSGQISASAIATLNVGGSLRGATVLGGVQLGTDGQIGGSGSAADAFNNGVLLALRVAGDLVDSRVAVSVRPGNDQFFDGDDSLVPGAPNGINLISIGGRIQGNSAITAPVLPTTVNVDGQTVDPTTLPGVSTNPGSVNLPSLALRLVQDTGIAGDALTSDPSVRVLLTDPGRIAQVQARFGDSGSFRTVPTTSAPGGGLRIDLAALTTLNGGSLPDGAYSLQVEAVDFAGQRSTPVTLGFTLDRTPPAVTALGLAPASDTGTPGDNSTELGTVTLQGTATAGAVINLAGQAVTAAANGSFSVSGVALNLGTNTFAYTATDAAGNRATGSLTITRVPPPDTQAPQITAAGLATDTGASSTDGITSVPVITGSASDNVAVTRLLATLAGGANPAYVDVSAALAASGSGSGNFTISRALMDTVAGGTLAQGAQSLRLVAEDAAGNRSAVATVNFTFDSTAPAITSVGLAPASDTGTVGDGITNLASVTVQGVATPGASVRLGERSVTAGENGGFSFDAVALVLGANTLVFTASDLAGNTATRELVLTREAVDSGPLGLTAALANDTGLSSTDGITNNVTINGSVTGQATRLLAVLDPSGDSPSLVDISAVLNGAGQFSIDLARLNTLAGGTLSQGAHVLRLVAETAQGVASDPVEVEFVFDSIAPALVDLVLAPVSDTPPLGDNTTTAESITVQGLSSAGATVTLGARSVLVPSNGEFSFADVALSLGANTLNFTATDVAGNTVAASLVVTRELADGVEPTLALRLTDDTGRSGSDNITAQPGVTGQLAAEAQAQQLLAVLNPVGAEPTLVDITARLGQDGRFTLDRAALDSLAGGTLAQGSHVLRVVLVDSEGQRTQAELTFTFDSVAPATGTAGLSASSLVPGTTNETTAGTAGLRGTAEPGSQVFITGPGIAANVSGLADNQGVFTLPLVPLSLGSNTFTLQVEDAAGNRSASFTTTVVRIEAPQNQTDPVLVWNQVALTAIQRDVTRPAAATRMLALVSVAIYDALAAIDGTRAFMVNQSVDGPASAQAAVAAAAHRILSLHYPNQRAIFDAALQTSLAAVPDGAAKTTGTALGVSVANAVWNLRSNDGSASAQTYAGGSDAGAWRPTGPAFAVAELPQFANVQPFAIDATSQFRPPPPPALDSEAYAADVNEVAALGRADSSTRTSDQTAAAIFWADGAGSYTPPGHWNQIAAMVAANAGQSLSDNARLFALLNVALADSSAAGWDAKYFYGLWRPETAIQNADADGNDATELDPTWRPLLITPPHPEYVSGHSTYSAAAATVLTSLFGDSYSFTTTSVAVPGVTRSFDSFAQASAEAGRSRVYGGIHYEFTNQAGNALGTQVGQAVLARFALSEDTTGPNITAEATPAASNTNITLTGQVLDNLSGVASAQFSIDGGAPQALTLDAQGRYSITTNFALDGSNDSEHLITIVATDAAGNTSTAFSRSFTLDTSAPTLVVVGVNDGDAITTATRITGAVNSEGTPVVQLNYRIDDGPLRTLVLDSENTFSSLLRVGDVGVGEHTLTVTARDAAGNVSTFTREVVVEALSPFTLGAVNPLDGASDVGSTFRPQVNFSRAVNPATLNANSLYATAPDGSKLAATIVPSQDGTFAWLFFAAPLPSGAQITLHVDGSRIRAAADGAFLDADGDGTPGGQATLRFTTVSTSNVQGTTVRGQVVDPGDDLLPMTFDDSRRGPDGVPFTADDVFLNPIAGAKVFILGREDQFVLTDEDGFFELSNVPAGAVKLAIDGRTATNAPDEYFWPEMVMALDLKPGVSNTVMGSMGTPELRLAHADRTEVYLPRVPTNSLQSVAASGSTVVTITDAASAPSLTDAQRDELTLTVAGGSAVGEDGRVLEEVQIGLSTVPPELVRDMLPPGVLQHTFDITIQAPGVATFSEPVQITFPNVFGAAPGTQLNILSFDHTTGLLVINGTGTVSADGLTVVSDPDSGVRAPGWHGLTPPGSPGNGPDNPPPDDPPDCLPSSQLFDTVVDLTTAAAQCAAELVAVGEGIKNALKVADKLRSIAGNVQSLLNRATPGAQLTPGEISAVLKIINDSKQTAVTVYDAFRASGVSPIDKAKGIAKCLEAILGALDNICGRILNNGDECSTIVTRTICTGIAIVKTTLGKVNSLIDAAERGLRDIGLALICSLIDQVATAFGIAGNLGGNSTPFGDVGLQANGDDTGPGLVAQTEFTEEGLAQLSGEEVDNLLRALQAELDLQIPIFQDIQDFAVGYDELLTDANNLDQTAAKIYSQHVAGLPSNAYFLITAGDTEIRGRTGADGKFEVFLPPSTDYTLEMYDPVRHRVAQVTATSSPSGQNTIIPAVAFASLDLSSLPLDDDGMRIIPEWLRPDGAGGILDRDNDGLPDVAERIVGTNPVRADTDRDGIRDRAELEQGLNPLDGQPVTTGVVGQVPLSGTAEAVAVAGTLDGRSTALVLVATGNHGLALINAGRLDSPRLLSELDLSGFASDVAMDQPLGLAVVAAGAVGVHIVDVTNMAQPRLVQTVALAQPVTDLVVRDGIAYAVSGNGVFAIDLASGELRSSLTLTGGGTLVDIARDGNVLYTLDNQRRLRAVMINGDLLTAMGSVVLQQAGGGLFVGGGVAYVGRDDGFNAGFSTVNISNPAELTLISGPDTNNIAGKAIVATGSGQAVTVGSPGGVFGSNVLDVVDVTNPANTDQFLSRVNLPAPPKDVVLANGIAYVAGGTGGLQVVNFRSVDTAQQPPTVSIQVEAVDADPDTAGVQVLEGRTLRIIPTVSDDVLVRNVELLINGLVVSNDVAFPYELFAQVPTGSNSINVQVRATDTGGNVGLSDVLSLSVVPDTFPPQVASVSIADGDRRFFVRSVDLVFDEPLDTLRLNTGGVSLVAAGADGTFGTDDDVSVPVRLTTRAFGQSVSVVMEGLLPPGDYRLTVSPEILVDRSGNVATEGVVRTFNIRPASDVRANSGVPEIPTAPSANPGQQIGFAVPFDPAMARATFSVVDAAGNVTQRTVTPQRFDAGTQTAVFVTPLDAVTADLVVFGLIDGERVDFADGTVPLQILPVVTGVDVLSVASDGTSATVRIAGLGFVEGGGSEYRFGSEVVLDAGTTTGPDVFGRSDALLGFIPNGFVQLTVPLVDGAFGAVNVKTAGGTSASFSLDLSGIEATALSGTPANADEASVNAGQSVTLTGQGLTTASDILLRYTDVGGSARMVILNPTAASADGTSATLVIPGYANGAPRLQLLGSASQPLLQVVPVLSDYDTQNRLVLFGSGLVEGATIYDLAGASVTDTPELGNAIDVWYSANSSVENNSAYLDRTALPTHGAGAVTVTTAGGTSAALVLDVTRTNVAGSTLGDVAVDAEGKYWVSDYTNPGSLLKIEPASGEVLQSINLSAAFGLTYTYNLAGLQVLDEAMTLGTTNVPAGSLLLFHGYTNPDRVVAINPTDGSIISTLVLAGNYDLVGGVYDATSGSLFVVNSATTMLQIDPVTGAVSAAITLPVSIGGHGGITVDPVSDNLWVGGTSTGNAVVEITRTGNEVRRVDLATRGVNQNEISGLAFDAAGRLIVSSTQDVVYRVDLDADIATVAAPTLTQVISRVTSGVAADAGQAATHVGDVIELVGTNFGAGTRVLFPVRDNAGNLSLASVAPLVVDETGTRMQVVVPGLADTGDIRVVNQGYINLGGNASFADAVYRNVSVSFTAGSSTAEVRFADGGLEAVSNESWGLDNVRVSQGGTTIFADDFDSGVANIAWSDRRVSSANLGTLGRFLGELNNASQTLSLSGLTAGQTYTVSFDLIVLDTWEGASPSQGPDLIDVSVDGVSLFRENFANNYGSVDTREVQTYNSSAAIRLQIVPTLTGTDGGRPGEANPFNLQGSGFMEGASTVTIGGVALVDNQFNTSPFDVTGTRNNTLSVLAPLTLDGPIRISTAGGYAELPGPTTPAQPLSLFTGITARTNAGSAGAPDVASATTGQTIVLQGQGFTSSTLVQFQGVDDSGELGTLTRTGSVGSGGTTLSVVVPALARSGLVSVLGSGTTVNGVFVPSAYELQVVPTITGVGGTVASGNTVTLTGTGLTPNDLVITIGGRTVGAFTLRTLVDGSSTNPDQQLLSFTVPAGINGSEITVSTAGGNASARTGGVTTALANLAPAADVGNTLADALTLALGPNQRQTINSDIGGALAGLDTDILRVDLEGGDLLELSMSGSLDTRLRIFDATGNQLTARSFSNGGGTAPLLFTVPSTGTYYLGVSSTSNTNYDPNVSGSGTGTPTGTYNLLVDRQGAGATRISSISASADSGTPASTALASANIGQTITLAGSGLRAGDRVVFTTINTSGQLGSLAVNATVDEDAQTLSVVVPPAATTGAVRLERDGQRSGVLLQIVPTLSDVNMNANSGFVGSNLALSGTGFAEGLSSVLLGDQRIDDISPIYGLSVTNTGTTNGRINLTVPATTPALPVGPIRVVTVGGTSEAFGLSLSGITATASSGTATTGTQASAVPGQVIVLTGSLFDATMDIVFDVTDAQGNTTDRVVRPTTVNEAGTEAQVIVPLDAVTGSVRLLGDANGQNIPLQILPVVTGVDVLSVASDGTSATVRIAGLGFVEGGGSEYRFGSEVVLDAGTTTGPDVFGRSDALLGFIPNGFVQLTVPLVDGAFGAVNVKTAGGTSASFSLDLSGIEATALSGTPANADEASVNAGQSVTLTGQGLTTASDILLRYTDVGGSARMVILNPTAASADGTSATLVIPGYANGAPRLQLLGSASQPLLQVVPVLSDYDTQNRLVLFGSGLVEGATIYDLAGASVTDTPELGNAIDVWYSANSSVENNSAYLDRTALPTHGAGAVTVTTAGGTSAALVLDVTRTNVAGSTLGDVAVDAEGKYWVSDYTNPGSLLKIEPASGEVLQSINLSAAFGLTYTYNLAGLQVLDEAMTLGTTNVPAGSLLLFHGYTNPDRVVAINPTDGSIISTLVLAGNYDLVGGVYDATSGSLFVVNSATTMLQIDPVTGAVSAAITLPVSIGGHGGITVDPVSDNLWVGGTSTGNAVVEITRTGNEVRRVDLATRGVNQNEISGLAFDAAGRLIVSSTQDVVYRVTLPS